MHQENWVKALLFLLYLLSPSCLQGFHYFRVFLSLWLTAAGMLWPCFQLKALDTKALQITMVYRPSVLFLCKFLEKDTVLMAAALTAEFSL